MKVLITESQDFSQRAITQLQEHFEVVQCDFKDRDELVANINEAEILFVRLRFKLTKEILEQATRLKYILTATTGLDHIDAHYFESRGGQVISLRGEIDFLGSIPSTAEHTWALLLALMRKIPSSFSDVKHGNWHRDNFKGHNLSGKKIGILGLGRVGKQVAHFAEAFGMKIGYFDTAVQRNSYTSFPCAEEMFAWADIITIHIPYNADNENFVNEKLLPHCKSETVLINTSRGNIWDEKCLAQLIQENKIAGIATDVLHNEFDNETIGQNLLVLLAQSGYNVIVTPHIAGATYESMAMTEDFIVSKFLKIISK